MNSSPNTPRVERTSAFSQPWRHSEATVNGVRLHYAESGEGEPVILLHGFPEFWYSWRRQLPELADAGFHTVAPDLRGYNESDRPPGVANYRTAKLIEDAAELIQHIAGGPAHVVGHDWGGVIAWRLASLRPELVRKLAILNAPHPAAFRRALWRNPGQWFRSAYVLLFQLPWLPEWLIRAGDFALLERVLTLQPSRPEAFTAEDIANYKRALGKPRALTSAINYYRAAMRWPGDLYGSPQSVEAPTLVIWGGRDPYLPVRLTEYLPRWARDLRIEIIPGASHWAQNDAPDRVNRLLVEFFRS